MRMDHPGDHGRRPRPSPAEDWIAGVFTLACIVVGVVLLVHWLT